jgi:hypothetical protein
MEDSLLLLILPHVGDGHPAQFRVGKPEKETAVFLRHKQLISSLFGHKAHDVAFAPWPAHVVARQVHDSVEPFPEGEVSVGQGFATKLRPRHV